MVAGLTSAYTMQLPQLDACRGVHRQKSCRCPADGGLSDNHKVDEFEMLVPSFASWIEDTDDLIRLQVYGCQVRALVKIATLARQAKIVQAIIGTMLCRNDVVYVERYERLCRLGKPTVLARVARTLDHEVPDCFVHATRCRSGYAATWLGGRKSDQ